MQRKDQQLQTTAEETIFVQTPSLSYFVSHGQAGSAENVLTFCRYNYILTSLLPDQPGKSGGGFLKCICLNCLIFVSKFQDIFV